MSHLKGALQELREERKQAQSQVEKLDQAISVIEALNGFQPSSNGNRPTRIISEGSRRKMALAQQARWAKARNGAPSVEVAASASSTPAKRTMSAAGRKRIAAAQRARWAKIKAAKKAA